jgi:hypothetical protein
MRPEKDATTDRFIVAKCGFPSVAYRFPQFSGPFRAEPLQHDFPGFRHTPPWALKLLHFVAQIIRNFARKLIPGPTV